jgi:hypothetical protein
MNLAPIDLVSAHRWERVTFTTYALSLSFFEAVVLDALIRGGARQALILADVQGVSARASANRARSASARTIPWSLTGPAMEVAPAHRQGRTFRGGQR